MTDWMGRRGVANSAKREERAEARLRREREERAPASPAVASKQSAVASSGNNEPVTVELATVADTKDFGRRLAAVLRPGDLLILDGPLGAGKTALAQGIAAGLGVRGAVTSPTFVIARVHQPDPQRGGRFPMVHADAYRLTGIAEVNDLDLDTSLEDAVTVVEWGEGKVEQLSDAHLMVRLHRRDDDTRFAELIGVGGDWPHRLELPNVHGGS